MKTVPVYLRSFRTCILVVLIVHSTISTEASIKSRTKKSVPNMARDFSSPNKTFPSNSNNLRVSSSGRAFDSSVSFTEMTGISLTGLYSSSAAWGDYDNDGDLDILLTGVINYNSTPVCKIYRNDGNDTFTEQTSISMTGIAQGHVEWGDYDNDGDLDILISGLDNSGPVCKIYRNDGNNIFTEMTNIKLAGISYGSVDWGDYDNDGDLDILLSGNGISGPITKIYRNDGNNIFTDQSIILFTNVYEGYSQWGDYDNDGDLDILLTGRTNFNIPIAKIYRNDGNNTFTELTGISLTGVTNGSAAWGDYDNDGDLDILLTGNNSSGSISKIYRNNGNDTFSEQANIILTGVYNSSVQWGDYDNDGDLDIILSGYTSGIPYYITKIYRNDGNNIFSEQSNIVLPAVYDGTVQWGDYDNDGDLDILMTGSYYSAIFRNDCSIPNSAPNAPTGLTYVINGKNVTLSWTSNGDNETSKVALTYNVKVGTSHGGSQIVSPNALGNGRLTVPAMGNAELGTSFNLKNLKMGTYYWSVQAVDNGYRGSAFATEGTFTLVSAEPNALVNNATNVTLNGVTLNGTVNANNINTTSWFEYGITEGIYDNWKSIASTPQNITGNNAVSVIANLTGLMSGTTYYFRIKAVNSSGTAYSPVLSFLTPPMFTEMSGISLMGLYSCSAEWGDYNNDGNMDLILSGISANTNLPVTLIYKNNGNNSFTEQTSISLSGVSSSSVQWGDYDNDGDLDILLAGMDKSGPICKIYRNDGKDIFTEQSNIMLPGISQGSAQWGDYDNDGDLDILLTGLSSSGYITKIIRNNGNNSFTVLTSLSLPGVTNGSAKWGDYDNDGYLDILITGDSNLGIISKIYRNNGNSTFSEQNGIMLKGLSYSSAAWGDYDNDGDLDLLITGRVDYSSTYASIIYRNEGNNNFTEQSSISLRGIFFGCVQWGDYDNDGNLDILMAGETTGSPGTITEIYRNNGNNTFTELTSLNLPPVSRGTVTWADFDNDGDLDILVTGNQFSKIFRNNSLNSNSAPSSPIRLIAIPGGNKVTLSWSSPVDKETPVPALTYNVRVGTIPGGSQIVSPHTLNNGKLTTPSMGNAQLGTSFFLNNLPFKKYYWSVQAVDNGFMGSAYATEGMFKIGPDVNTTPAQITSSETVTLNGTVDPKGFELESYFSYGPSKSSMNSSKSITQTLKSNGGLQNVSTTLTGITPGNTYYYHLNVNVNGDISSGDTITFNTGSPRIITVSADSITTNSVRLVSVVNPYNSNSTVTFEYGTTADMGQTINSPGIITGTNDQQVSLRIGSLNKNTIYFYRVKTTNAIGTNYSSINQFITKCNDNILSNKPVGLISVCQGTAQSTYTTSSLTAFSYVWEILPVTAGTVSGTGVTGIVTWNPLYSGTAQLKVRGENGTCQSVWTQQLQVDIKPGPVSASISGLEPVCKGQDNCEYSIDPVNGISYSWDVTGGIIKDGSRINNIKVQWSAIQDTGYVYLTQILTSTGCSLTDRKIVTKNMYTPPFALGIKKKGSINLLICLSPEMTGYQWYLNDELIPDATEQYYVARNKYGSYSVKITDKHGCFSFSFPESINSSNGLSVYPNPTSGEIDLALDCEQKGDVVIKVVDSYGVVRYIVNANKTESKMIKRIILPAFRRGTYILEIEIDGEKIENCKILIL